MDVITTHTNADFDALGAMIAAARLYPGARLSFPGSQEKCLRDFAERHPEYLPTLTRAKEIDLDAVSRLIIVDCQEAVRIGRFADLVGRSGVEVHIYDHHPVSSESIHPDSGVLRPCGSASSLLAGLLRERGIGLTPEEATLVMLGIHEDTGRLLFPSVTAEDYQAAAWLVGQGARLAVVAESLSQELTAEQVGLLDKLLRTLKTTSINGISVSIAHTANDTYVADIAALAHIIKDMENLEALFLVVSLEDRIHLVARSRVPEVNVGDILRRFHGGGHATAASATVRGKTLKQVLERLDTLLRVAVSPRIRARDIMSSPVKSLPDDISISEARELLTRYNCNAMPILREGRMTGVISRKTVEKALYHSLGEASITDFMHTEFLRATPETLLTDIQEYMVGGNRRFVPVFEGEALVGAVTRTDLLRHMYGGQRGQPEALYDVEALAPAPRSRDIAGMVAKRLPPPVVTLLRELGRAGDELGLPIYAVGGFVRDLLLGVENLDMDVTVEGDGIFFAERFAAGHGCRVRSHHKFGTAVIVFPDGMKVDVASTRLEYYESPGVLPTVERSSLRHDLYRRDFTINTLAFCINARCFGQLTDYYSAQRDLQERMVRVLHNLSFVEDPTRVFRAIRFEQRLGFTIAPHTANLIKSAVRMSFLDKLGGSRLLNELEIILREKSPTGAVERMAYFGLLPCIHPTLKLGPETGRVIHEAGQVLAWFRLLFLNQPCDQWPVYFLALCDGLSATQFREACDRLAVCGAAWEKVFSHRARALGMLDALQRRLKRSGPVRNSDVYAWFHDHPLEILLYVAAKASREEVRKLVSLYVSHLRKVRCSLTGDDLKRMGLAPGPDFGRVVQLLHNARLDEEVTDEAGERTLAASLIAATRDALSTQ